MCGIFGAVALNSNTKWNQGTVRALAWANRERGTDSLGFFDSSGKMTKAAGDPSDVLHRQRISAWLNKSQADAWFIAGHTRFATRGKVNRRNSHPFRYGRIIGSHNGMCDAPSKFTVDSEYLFYSLNKARGEYQDALGEIGGYWGLSWYDGEHFYLMCHNGELSYDIVDGVLYYSSSHAHLDSCTGGNCKTMKEGQVIRIGSDGTIDNSEDKGSPIATFVNAGGKASYYGTRYAGYGAGYDWNDSDITGRSGSTTYTGRKASNDWRSKNSVDDYLSDNGTDVGNAVKDYDAEWQDAWSDYCTDSEHNADADSERYAG
jgi:hypothetical protein